jgi:hypothetical protein
VPAEITPCEAETSLTDADIAAIVRGMAGGGDSAHDITTIVLTADCRLGKGHGGPCACWVASARDGFGDTATAWLRWSRLDRAVDWLVDCVTAGCPLFRGHAGGCAPYGRAADACELCHDAPRGGHTCPECGITGAGG